MIHLELEDRNFLARLKPLPVSFTTFARPAEVDVDWHRTENQGPIGSCQGNDLASCLERLQFVRTNDKSTVIQLSRIFAYLATQKIDRLLGSDRGSTITGGVKLALQHGVCPESLTGYPSRYPSTSQIQSILTAANYAAGQPYKAEKSWQCPEDPEEAMNFIGAGGAISIGIMWYSGLIPRDRIVRRFSPSSRGGGHAMAVLGYTRNGNLVAVNSHGDGRYEIEPGAWISMMKHRYTAAVGLACDVKPRIVDWESELVFIPDSPLEFVNAHLTASKDLTLDEALHIVGHPMLPFPDDPQASLHTLKHLLSQLA